MAMTRAQWDALQRRLPAEDREPYESYLASQGLTTAPATPLAAAEGGQIAAISMGTQTTGRNVPAVTVVTPAEETPKLTGAERAAQTIEARKQRFEDELAAREASKPTEDPGPGMVWSYSVSEKRWKKIRVSTFGGSTQDANTGNQNIYKGSGTTGDPLTLNGVPFTGTYNGRQYNNGVLVASNNNNAAGGVYTGDGTSGNPLLFNNTPFNGVLGGVTYVNGIAQAKGDSTTLTAADIEAKGRRTAQQDFKAALGELGLADLAGEVDRMIQLDYTVAQIKMELPKTTTYQQRFPGMEALRKAGRAISEATYLSNERGYLQTLRAYGLDTAILGSRSALGTYISNEVSPREFEERVNMASTRVKENPDVMATFKTFYPEIDEGGVIAYMLNPKQGMDIIRKQLRTSEIGAAATASGFAKDIMSIEQSANLIPAVGESTYAQIANEFQRARQLANNQRRLAQIEQTQYSDLEAIGAVVGDDVTKALASQQRAAREVARFGATGGLTAGALRTTEVAI